MQKGVLIVTLVAIMGLILWFVPIVVAEDQAGGNQGGSDQPGQAGATQGTDQQPPVNFEEEVNKKLAEAQKKYASRKEEDRLDALNAVGELKHPKVMAFLGKVLCSDASDDLRDNAARYLGGMKDKQAVPHLKKGLDANKKKLRICGAICRALGDIGNISCLDPLVKFAKSKISKFVKEEVEPVSSAIEAIGKIKHKDSIGELLKMYEPVENARNLDDAQNSVRQAYSAALNNALQSLTQQQFGKYEEWKKWWNANKKKFDPAKPPEEAGVGAGQ